MDRVLGRPKRGDGPVAVEVVPSSELVENRLSLHAVRGETAFLRPAAGPLLRRGVEDDDRAVRDAVAGSGLGEHANVFFLQAYGFAVTEAEWDPPRPVSDRFTLVNPDGRILGPDLIARSEAMRRLA